MQVEVDNWVNQFTPPYWPPLEQFGRLAEEVGEVARELNHLHGTKKKKAEEAQQELGQELIDVIFTVVCLANSHNINLEAEWGKMVNEKMHSRDKDRYQKVELPSSNQDSNKNI